MSHGTRVIDLMDIDSIVLTGNPSDRGLWHGRTRRAPIRRWLDDWQTSLRDAGIGDVDDYLAHFMRQTHFCDAIECHAPDLLQEIRATAEGAGVSPQLLLAAQLMDEEWEFRRRYLDLDRPDKCSSVALVSTEGVWVGQNMDLGAWTDGHQVLLHLKDGREPAALILSMGAMLALLGVNDRGIAVFVNALPGLPSDTAGLPVAFIIRKLLQAETFSQAAGLIQECPHASSQHYLIADAREARSFEATPEDVVEYRPTHKGRIFHTNHPLGAPHSHCDLEREREDTVARLEALSRRLLRCEPGVDAIRSALASSDDSEHPVCRPYPAAGRVHTTNFTMGSMIVQLQPYARRVESWVSLGPPDRGDFAACTLSCPAVLGLTLTTKV
jgi:isopenicillin-N N-acyltransferase-like protein